MIQSDDSLKGMERPPEGNHETHFQGRRSSPCSLRHTNQSRTVSAMEISYDPEVLAEHYNPLIERPNSSLWKGTFSFARRKHVIRHDRHEGGRWFFPMGQRCTPATTVPRWVRSLLVPVHI